MNTPPPSNLAMIRYKKRFYRFFSCVTGLLLCAITPGTAYAVIITTLPPLAGLVSMLDTKADVHCLLPPGADAHHFQLTPKQVQQLKQADLLVRASRDDGNWPGLSISVRQMDLWPKRDHAWLLPSEVRRILPSLAKKLQEIEPGRRQAIAQSLKRALHICDNMERAWALALASVREHGVIMQHPAWRRLCEHFNVPVWEVLEPRQHGSIRPRKLEHALHLIKTRPGILLWGDMRHSNRGLVWLSRHDGNKPVLQLDTLGTCGMTWVQLMQDNLARLTV